MVAKIKVASTVQELDDIYQLRHWVYVIEDGKFGGVALPGRRIVDRFDALGNVANIIAYDDGTPVGSLRLNKDGSAGLPSEEYYDFSRYRVQLIEESKKTGKALPVFASGGFLAVKEAWRGRRKVIFSLLKTAAGVYQSWGVTHLIATVNHETVSVYRHLGFEPIDDPIWVESIGNQIVPMVTPFQRMYEWAFGNIDTKEHGFWVKHFSAQFQRVLLSPKEILFKQGELADDAFIIDEGWISISRKDEDGQELVLANLSPGALFGELALIDNQPRSGTAIASTNVELICLNRDEFQTAVTQNKERLNELLTVFATRMRSSQELAMILAFAPQTGRVHFALNTLRHEAVEDKKRPNSWVAKIDIATLAKSAGVREHEVRRVLEVEAHAGKLEYSERSIRFLS